jgi:hypothetical protein
VEPRRELEVGPSGFHELDEPRTDGRLEVLALDPELGWIAHENTPWRPRTV